MKLIESTIDHVLSISKPNLPEGFVIDTKHYFGMNELFDSIEIEQSKDPRNLLQVHLVTNSSPTKLQEISKEIFDVWRQLRYHSFDANGMLYYKEAMVFRFITAAFRENTCITGSVTVRCPHYPVLVAKYEKDHHKLESMPV